MCHVIEARRRAGRAGSSPRRRDSSVKTGKARRQVIFLRWFDNELGNGDMGFA